MFTVGERERLREQLIERARADDRVVGCALLGSAARDEEDAWSDIDLALRLVPTTDLDAVVKDWTAELSETVQLADTFDLRAFGALYRVFLCTTSMQIDLSFWPYDDFRSTGEPLRMVFGDQPPASEPTHRDSGRAIRMGWLYALHARSAIARGRIWQAEMMLSDLRNQILALACLRSDLNPDQGRAAHLLPPDVTDALLASRATGLDEAELRRSLRKTLGVYLHEVEQHDQNLAASLAPTVGSLQA